MSQESRILLYVEDDAVQGITPFLFSTDCPWTTKQLRELSREAPNSDITGARFRDFRRLLMQAGFKCVVIDLGEDDETPEFEEVRGAASTNTSL